jgi:hypothetical protein
MEAVNLVCIERDSFFVQSKETLKNGRRHYKRGELKGRSWAAGAAEIKSSVLGGKMLPLAFPYSDSSGRGGRRCGGESGVPGVFI